MEKLDFSRDVFLMMPMLNIVIVHSFILGLHVIYEKLVHTYDYVNG
jgi:hypothetical protein